LQSDYRLDVGYLTNAPAITWWGHVTGGADAVTVRQRILSASRDTFDGPELREVSVPTAEFFAAVYDFDRRSSRQWTSVSPHWNSLGRQRGWNSTSTCCVPSTYTAATG
jgi:hypothetical protein